mmetsp:Transcript_26028/g.55373  ORF Transcript_26028/g.55373 Transcript_26028/m.55373 type:complete len:347 (+) Transcript_26028:296-1336(+)
MRAGDAYDLALLVKDWSSRVPWIDRRVDLNPQHVVRVDVDAGDHPACDADLRPSLGESDAGHIFIEFGQTRREREADGVGRALLRAALRRAALSLPATAVGCIIPRHGRVRRGVGVGHGIRLAALPLALEGGSGRRFELPPLAEVVPVPLRDLQQRQVQRQAEPLHLAAHDVRPERGAGADGARVSHDVGVGHDADTIAGVVRRRLSVLGFVAVGGGRRVYAPADEESGSRTLPLLPPPPRLAVRPRDARDQQLHHRTRPARGRGRLRPRALELGDLGPLPRRGGLEHPHRDAAAAPAPAVRRGLDRTVQADVVRRDDLVGREIEHPISRSPSLLAALLVRHVLRY